MLRLFMTAVILAVLSLSSFAVVPAGSPVWTFDNGVWKAGTGSLSMSVDASNGGRIISFTINGYEVLYYNRGQKLLSGSTFWHAPQDSWVPRWPPSKTLDSGIYQSEVLSNGRLLKLISGTDPKTGFIYEKTFSFSGRDGWVDMGFSIINTSQSNRRAAPWQVTRVPAGGLAFFRRGEDFKGKSDLEPTLEDSVVWLRHKGQKNQKMFRDGKDRWLSYAYSNIYIIKKWKEDIPVSAFAPGEAEVELYSSPVYLELECQGAFTDIPPGGKITWKVSWYLGILPEGLELKPGNAALLKTAVDKAQEY